MIPSSEINAVLLMESKQQLVTQMTILEKLLALWTKYLFNLKRHIPFQGCVFFFWRIYETKKNNFFDLLCCITYIDTGSCTREG
jgi:hypothetical protein